jgi:hypothetical protein
LSHLRRIWRPDSSDKDSNIAEMRASMTQQKEETLQALISARDVEAALETSQKRRVVRAAAGLGYSSNLAQDRRVGIETQRSRRGSEPTAWCGSGVSHVKRVSSMHY